MRDPILRWVRESFARICRAGEVFCPFLGRGARVGLAGPLTGVTEVRGMVLYEGREVGRVVFDFLS